MPPRSPIAGFASARHATRRFVALGWLLVLFLAAEPVHFLAPALAQQPYPAQQVNPGQDPDSHDDESDAAMSPQERGRQLYRALRCDACHEGFADDTRLSAPALDRLPGQLRRAWLVEWLTAKAPAPGTNPPESSPLDAHRRMPYLAVTEQEAWQLADYLLETPEPPVGDGSSTQSVDGATRDSQVAAGRTLFLTLGCLACHPESPTASLFGGGDLARIADKRPAAFFARWLADPASLNRDHRMPVFTLSPEERHQLAAFLAARRSTANSDVDAPPEVARPDPASREAGRAAFLRHRCHACHRGPDDVAATKTPPRVPLDAHADWDQSCAALDAGDSRPGYRRPKADVRALADYVSIAQQLARAEATTPADRSLARGAASLEEHQCLACHAREVAPQLEREVERLTAQDPILAPLADALLPPTLKTVGAKLRPDALRHAMLATQPPRRPWLRVRMPRYAWKAGELESLADHLRDVDQRDEFAEGTASHLAAPPRAAGELQLAGSRLVTADGFGCVSCHAIGSVAPARPEPGKQGPDLRSLGQRIRPEWFASFVRNPARISPRMEMPSIQVGVAGVLDGHLDDQLAALWHVLNEPGFEPPRPDPVRILRQLDVATNARNADNAARSLLLNDIVRETAGADANHTWIYPLLVGFPHRHNGLYDLESARLARWSLGDMAYQRTEGKRWYWEPAGHTLLRNSDPAPEFSLVLPDATWEPVRDGQFFTRIDNISHEVTPQANAVQFLHRLHFREPGGDAGEGDAGGVTAGRHFLRVQQTWRPIRDAQESGFQRELVVACVPRDARLQLDLRPQADAARETTSPTAWRVDPVRGTIDDGDKTRVRWHDVAGGEATLSPEGILTITPHEALDGPSHATLRIVVDYRTQLQADRFAASPPPANPAGLPPTDNGVSLTNRAATAASRSIAAVPGFRGERLPLPLDEMPTAMAWLPSRPDRADARPTLLFASLKGRVLAATDRDGDGLEESLSPFSDELATPYGLAVRDGAVDVLTKTGLLRLFDDDHDLRTDRMRMIADGWGHTDDYHDWAVGLPIDREGRYYVGLPCQQDDRSAAAAWLRGRVLQLVPREPTEETPREYDLREFAAGQRFPMGLALDQHDRLFASDNQGNYNAYNELNHIVPGGHYGFINRLERTPTPATATPATVTAAAIELPHPWTRSVNGICFLHAVRDPQRSTTTFGPWEGHLVGCEYDTRRLVRMSLETIDGTMQGAAYPMSRDEGAGTRFLGPVCAAIGPDGALYVGGLRDSGWGGANNIGEVVRLEYDEADMPTGIAEIQARPRGFRIQFSRPVDAARAADPQLYRITSAYRVSTPAYGGDDQDPREERIRKLTVTPDHLAVILELDQIETGRVYAFQLPSLAIDDGPFFPAEGYYTLRRIPRD